MTEKMQMRPIEKKPLTKGNIISIVAAIVCIVGILGTIGWARASVVSADDLENVPEEYANLPTVILIGADSTGKDSAGQFFGEYVAKRVGEITGGKLTIDYHANGDLGGDADILRQVQSNDIQLTVCQTAPVVNFVPEMAVFDLPVAFATYDGDTIDDVLNNDNSFSTALGEAYEKADLHALGFLQNATFRLTTSNRDLKSLSDFSGLQIRTMENSNHMAFWQAIGAEPTPLAWAEVYISLQNGTVDAEENAADTISGASFQEVQKYLACTNHILYCNQICMSQKCWESLDPAYRAAIEQAVAEAIEYMRPQMTEIDQSNKQKLADGGMEIIEYEDSFFDEILAKQGVKDLYSKIDADTGGLGTILTDALADADQDAKASTKG